MSDTPTQTQTPAPKNKGLFGRPILLGCLGIFALFCIALAAGAYWLFTSGKSAIANVVRDEITMQIEKSGLPETQQLAIQAEVDRLTDGFKSGEIAISDMVKIVEELGQSPAMSVVKYYTAAGDPLQRETISPEQRKDAMLTIRRFVYGVFEEKIPDNAIEDLMRPFVVDPSQDIGDMEFRTNISDEEIFRALDKAKNYADQAGIASSNLSPDIAGEIREIVDRILANRE